MIDRVFLLRWNHAAKGIARYSKAEVGKQLISCTLLHSSHGWM